MASFTDAISQFNPYVQQLPTELMAKVGMQKQAQYEAGVQKVQTYIDNVAGLEVARPYDKQVLRSKLNSLGNNLKVVAGGDFSNQQLVNSVAGMATEVISDPQIKNAVLSTANLKKQEAEMEKDVLKGQGLENQDLFNDQKMRYLSSTDPNGSFANGKYVPYINVNQKLKDAAAMVGEDSNKVMQLFKTDSSGNPIPEVVINPKTGKPEFRGYQMNPVAKTESIKGKSAEKILKAFKSMLTPADYQQLAITGRYVYKNYSPEELAEAAGSIYNSKLAEIDNQIEKQRMYLFTAENAPGYSREDIETHAGLYKDLNSTRDMLLENKNNAILKALENPDAVKGSLYSDAYLSNMSLIMSSAERAEDYELSPLYTIDKDNRDYALQLRRQTFSERMDIRADQRAERKEQREELEFNIKYGTQPGGMGLPFGANIPLDIESAGESIVSQNEENVIIANDIKNQKAKQLTKQFFKTLPGNQDLTDAQLDLKIANTLKKYNAPIVPGEENVILSNFATKMLAAYAKDKNKIPAENRGVVDDYGRALEDATYFRTIVKDVEAKAAVLAKQKGLDVKTLEDIDKNIKSTKVKVDGFDVALSKQDVKDLAILINSPNTLFKTGTESDQSGAAESRLKARFGNRLPRVVNSVLLKQTPGTAMATMQQPVVTNPEISKAISLFNTRGAKELVKIKAQIYKDLGYVPQGVSVPIVPQEGEKEGAVGGRLYSLLSTYGKDLIPDYESVIANVEADKFKASVDIQPTSLGGDVRYFLNVSTGGKETKIEINPSNYTFLTRKQQVQSPNVPAFVRFLDTKGTTNMTGAQNPNVGNKFKDSDFVNFSSDRYTLTGDLVTSSNLNDYYLKIYKHDKRGEEPVKVITYDRPIPKMVGDQINPELSFLPRGINNDVLKQLESKK